MSPWLIILVGLIYLYIAVESFIHGDNGMGFMYIGYSLANVGAYILAVR